MDRIQSLMQRCNYRTALMGLHILIFVESLITGPIQLTGDYTETNYDNGTGIIFEDWKTYMDYIYFEKSIVVTFITGSLSLIFAIVGFFCPGVYEDSSMVVHSSIYLWIVHLIFMMGCTNTLPYSSNFNGSVRLEFMFVNALKVFLLTAVVVLATKLLRKNNSVWPRSNLMKFFSLEFPIISTRMILGYIIFVHDPIYHHYYYEKIGPSILDTEGLNYFTTFFNAIISTEHFVSLFWGILHQKTVAAQTIFNTLMIFIMLIVHGKNKGNYFFSRPSWYILIAVLSLLHGILSLCLPQFVTKIPEVFTRDYEQRSNTARVTQSGDRSGTYSRFDGLLNSTEETENEENSVPSSAEKLSLRQLSRQSPLFFRHFLYIVTCSTNLIMLTVGLQFNRSVYNAWIPVLLLCVNVTVLMRSIPDFMVELITRKPIKEPPLVKSFSSVLIESILLMIGSLASLILFSIMGIIFIFCGLGNLAVVIINLLFLRTYVLKSRKVSTVAAYNS